MNNKELAEYLTTVSTFIEAESMKGKPDINMHKMICGVAAGIKDIATVIENGYHETNTPDKVAKSIFLAEVAAEMFFGPLENVMLSMRWSDD